jgi:hypothetical protein
MIATAFFFGMAAVAPGPNDYSTKETRRLIRNYGDCIVNRQQRRASEAILADVSNAELLRRYPKLIDGYCLPSTPGIVVQARFQGDQYHYALAEALVKKELGDAPAPDFSKVPVLYHRDAGPEPSRTAPNGKPLGARKFEAAVAAHGRAQAFRFLSLYGECVVRAEPAASRALLMAEADTPQEQAQFTALSAAFGTCMPEGRTMALGKVALRGTIAINYYRLAKAAGAATAPGAAR